VFSARVLTLKGGHCVSWSLSRPCAVTGTLLYSSSRKTLSAILVLVEALVCLLWKTDPDVVRTGCTGLKYKFGSKLCGHECCVGACMLIRHIPGLITPTTVIIVGRVVKYCLALPHILLTDGGSVRRQLLQNNFSLPCKV
jgi:hypothetical protein